MATRETKTPTTRSSRARRDSALNEGTDVGGRYATRRAAATGFEASAVDEPASSSHDEIKRNQVVVDGEEYQLAEGDLLLDQDQAEIYALDQRVRRAQNALMTRTEFNDAPVAPGAGTSALVAIGQNGQIVRWAPGVVLTFCVLRETFPDQEKYDLAAQNMQLAAQQWMNVCGIEFRYLPEFDTSTSLRPEGVVFPVRHINANGASSPLRSSLPTRSRAGGFSSTRRTTRRPSTRSACCATSWGTRSASGTSTSAPAPRRSARTSRPPTPST